MSFARSTTGPPWHPEQALTVEQAFQATMRRRRRGSHATSAAAASSSRATYADLVVLDRDPLAIEPEELAEIEVVATMLGGRWIHNPPPWD